MKKHKTRKQKLAKKTKAKKKQFTLADFFGYEIGQWIWCKHCSRCYQYGEQRQTSDGLEYCHYQDCNGDALVDSSTWETVRFFKPEYPEIPERDTKYLLDIELSGVW